MQLVIEVRNGAVTNTYSDDGVDVVIVDYDLDEPHLSSLIDHDPISEAPKEAREYLDLD